MTWQKKAVFVTVDQAIKKLEKYCAYQERSQKQVEQKCRDYGLTAVETGEVMVHLIQGDFLNESRFAHAYVRGKQKIKGWGRDKILQGLKTAGIPEKLAFEAMGEMNSSYNLQHLEKWTKKKLKSLKFTDDQIEEIFLLKLKLEYQSKQKLMQFLFTKGFPVEEQKRALSFL